MSRFTNAISADELFETPVNPVMPCATRVNTRESNPGVMRPLDLTVVAIPMDHGIRRSLRDLGIHDNDPPGFIGRIHHGRWYVNLSWVMWQADILPFTRAADWEAQLFGSTGSFVIERPRLTGSQRLRRNVFLPRFLFRMVQAVAGRRRRLQRSLDARRDFDASSLSPAELRALLEAFQNEIETAAEWLTRGTMASMLMVSLLARICGAERMPQIIAVLSDLGEVESAAPALRIQNIARRLKEEFPRAAAGFGSAPDKLAWLRSEAPLIAVEVDRLLDRYGYRSGAEIMITAPSWADDPRPVFDSIAGLMGEQRQPEHAIISRDEPLALLVAGQRPMMRPILRLLVHGAHLSARTREECKANLVVRVDLLRRLSREIARRLCTAGFIGQQEDIELLTLGDIEQGLRGEPRPEMAATIASL